VTKHVRVTIRFKFLSLVLGLDQSHNPCAMRLTLVNRTDSLILYHLSSITSPDEPKLQIALLPSSSTTTDLPKYCTKLTLVRRERLKHDSSSELGEPRVKEEAPVSGFDVLVKSLGTARAREVVAVDDEHGRCPWRIYCMKVNNCLLLLNLDFDMTSKVSRKHYKLIVLPRRDLSSFLANVPDTVPISSLLLPGKSHTPF
jgi:1-phosphatidylinositol phosphodiesterase